MPKENSRIPFLSAGAPSSDHFRFAAVGADDTSSCDPEDPQSIKPHSLLIYLMAGHQKPRLPLSSAARAAARISLMLRLFFSLLISTLLGSSLLLVLPNATSPETIYLTTYLSLFLVICSVVFGQLRSPFVIDCSQLFSFKRRHFHRSHVSHMRMDRLIRLPGYWNSRTHPCALYQLISVLSSWLFGVWRSIRDALVYMHDTLSPRDADVVHDAILEPPDLSDDDGDFVTVDEYAQTDEAPPLPCFGLAMRLRGGSNSDNEDMGDSDPESAQSLCKRRRLRLASPDRSRKIANKGNSTWRTYDSDSDSGMGERVTTGGRRGKGKGMRVAQVIDLVSVPEYWDVPHEDHPLAYIVDFSETPKCLVTPDKKKLTIDGFIKKQCQDSLSGPTGSTKEKHLAEVLILDPGSIVLCRRSNLTCGGSFMCSEALSDYLEDFERWDESDGHDLVSGPIRAAKRDEAVSLLAIATAFYESVTSKYCRVKGPDGFKCGGHAVYRKYLNGKVNGKEHFIGCSNWVDGDGLSHRHTPIGSKVRESILGRLFRGESVDSDDAEDEEAVTGPCHQIVHPAHLPNDKACPRTHFRDSKRVRGALTRKTCPAQILILIPTCKTDLRAVVIPKAGAPHNHPIWPRTKVPFAAVSLYTECIEGTGPLGHSTLQVDKSSATRSNLKGKLPQEIHPGLVNNRARRELVNKVKLLKFPSGNGISGLSAVWHEFEQDKSRTPENRYIHAVNTLADGMHIIVTMNPDLAALALDATWIMVDTTFAVVHGETNEWKLLIWLNELDKRVTIGRVWSNRATREAFVVVWNGIFDAIETITGKALNFKAFSKTSSLICALGDSEAAQAQGLGDMIILRRLNPSEVNGMPTVTVDQILMFIWKTCVVHFFRGILALKAHIEDEIYHYLCTFPFLETEEDIQAYYTFCSESGNAKLKAWWAHKLSYPWLLPSLNRRLSKMSAKSWELTPCDTNPLEGSHAQDNQVNNTNHSLIEAILLARQLDDHNARVIKASIEGGIWENGNNSLQARFSSQNARKANVRAKKVEAEQSDHGGKMLKSKLAASARVVKQQELEIQQLRFQLGARTSQSSSSLAREPISTPRHRAAPPTTFIDVDALYDDALPNSSPIADSSPVAGPSQPKLPSLLSHLHQNRTTIPFPRAHVPSDCEDIHVLGMRSDYMDRALDEMARSDYDFRLYAVDGIDDILASDPRPCSP